MGKVLVFALLVLASLRSASTEEPIKEGGSVTLDLRPVPSGPITIIQWKFQDSILAEWVKDVLPLDHNRKNIKLNIVSGELTMEKMATEDTGVYSVEVNNNVQKETYNVLVIKDVPKPSIWVSPLACSDEDDQCTLTCEGNTTGAEPVTYSWKTGDEVWKKSEKLIPITKKEHGQVKVFTCKMKNPVSEKESDPLLNGLYIIKKEEQEGYSTGGIVGGIFGFLLVAAVAPAVGIWWACKNDKFPYWKQHIAKNGNARTSKADGEATLVLMDGSSPTNTSPGAKPGSEDGPAGGVADPLLKEKPPGSQEEPADPPLNTPHENNTDIKDEPAEEEAPPKPPHEKNTVIEDPPTGGEADTELDAKL
ncbi:hypothetical protein OYC64_012628 [Pagothenia borchgrevinki]|uniref:Ig-like domain-containing protein n=1 Tax=Pagothenia borchgrevinki TaxID=8213 RepID=A0ABD2GBC2_PAGBO